jgi:hypothetical protein
MSSKDLSDVPPTRPNSNARTSDSLSNEPVPAVKGSRPPVERVAHHIALLDWPS